jgi:hypothetical protein
MQQSLAMGIGWVGTTAPFALFQTFPPVQINSLQKEDFLAHYPIREVRLGTGSWRPTYRETAQPHGQTRRMAVLLAEVEVEAGPLVVVRALGRWHPSPFQPPLKGYPGFSGNRLPCNIYG